MKLFQKTYPLVGIILLLSGGIFSAANEEISWLDRIYREISARKAPVAEQDEISLIKSAYRGVFGAELFARKNDDTDDWYDMLDILQTYVENNADNDKTLLEAFDLCKITSYKIINTLMGVFNTVFAGSKWPSRATVVTAYRMVSKLQETEKTLLQMSNKLKGKFYFGERKKNVRKVLLYLIQVLETTIGKLVKDFYKRNPLTWVEN